MSSTKHGHPEGKDRGEDRQVSPVIPDFFTCHGMGCITTERAEEMFNLSCNPSTITLERLKDLVLCRNCATDVAERRGKRLGEPGCGVYPLRHTLKTIRDGASRADEPPDLFACGDEGCSHRARAGEMYNIPCRLHSTSMDELRALVRCPAHADGIAAARGKRAGEPGSGVCPLLLTLRRIGGTADDRRQKEELEYVRWVEETQRQRLRKEREDRLTSYAGRYVETSVFEDDASASLAPPHPRRNADRKLTCGIPIDCCDHEAAAERFIVVRDMVVGICGLAAEVFGRKVEEHRRECGTEHLADQRYRRLLSTESIDKAREIADRWGRDADGDPSPKRRSQKR